jgi:hypothetical protein
VRIARENGGVFHRGQHVDGDRRLRVDDRLDDALACASSAPGAHAAAA